MERITIREHLSPNVTTISSNTPPLAESQEQQATFTPECTIKNTSIFISSPHPQPRYRCCFMHPSASSSSHPLHIIEMLTRLIGVPRQFTEINLTWNEENDRNLTRMLKILIIILDIILMNINENLYCVNNETCKLHMWRTYYYFLNRTFKQQNFSLEFNKFHRCCHIRMG